MEENEVIERVSNLPKITKLKISLKLTSKHIFLDIKLNFPQHIHTPTNAKNRAGGVNHGEGLKTD